MPSGGHNKLDYSEHVLRNNVRPYRHQSPSSTPVSAPLAPADRRRTLDGLAPEARRLAATLLLQYSPWDAASLVTLRSYVRSCVRLEQLQVAPDAAATPALAREIRINLALLKALEFERP
jgi:hypothetical protein